VDGAGLEVTEDAAAAEPMLALDVPRDGDVWRRLGHGSVTEARGLRVAGRGAATMRGDEA
jgi:hypothetical protein